MPSAQQTAGHSDPYLPIEEVASRLDLPLSILLRRAQAGDIPARREHGVGGVRYSIRLSDLGFDPGTQHRARIDDSARVMPRGGLDVVGSAQSWPVRPAEPPPAPPAAPPPVAETQQQTQAVQVRPTEPRSELATMPLDPRELVAGLLDRWERTLEQRIYAEQRVRFEAELNNRQNLVKQLQLELQASRAEQAAAIADRDRRLSEQERRAQQLQDELATARAVASKRRGIFRR
jgi:hypothetical protein